MSKRSYEDLFWHLQGHHAKKWLLKGCHDEDANTIRRAVEKMSESRLNRRLARILSQDD